MLHLGLRLARDILHYTILDYNTCELGSVSSDIEGDDGEKNGGLSLISITSTVTTVWSILGKEDASLT